MDFVERLGGKVPWRAAHNPAKPSGSIGTNALNGFAFTVTTAMTIDAASEPSR